MSLFDDNLAWAMRCARYLTAHMHTNDYEDGRQAALVAFWQACLACRPCEDLRRYAYRRMRGAVVDAQRTNHLVGSRRVHVDTEPLSYDLADGDSSDIDDRDELDAARRRVPVQLRPMFDMLRSGATQVEIARRCGLCKTRTARKVSELMRYVRKSDHNFLPDLTRRVRCGYVAVKRLRRAKRGPK